MKKSLILLSLLFLLVSVQAQQNSVVSPDGSLRFELNDADGLTYTITRNGQKIIDEGKLGLDIKNAVPLGKYAKLKSVKINTIDDSWKPVLKQHQTIRNHYNEAVMSLAEYKFPGRKFNIIVRAYNDGVAFRYDFPLGSWGQPVLILHE